MADGAVNSNNMRPPILSKVCTSIVSEMKTISSIDHNSFLRNSKLKKKFSWKAVYDELTQNLPTLMMILSGLIPKSVEHKPLQCLIASQLLKCRHPKMGLVQQAISVMLYGNSIAKQVHNYKLIIYLMILFKFAVGACKSSTIACVLDIPGDCKHY